MKDRALNRLFLRFRDRADGSALAAVFDSTARELLEVATHLVGEPQEAEDLVQHTFQVAIEKATAYRDEMRVKAWLYGILWREAAKVRRRAARELDPARVAQSPEREPLENLVAQEFPQVVERALEKVPASYREVLDPLIRDGRKPHEIARELGRAPGTVRMQILRGMNRLRRSLPTGYMAVGGAFLPGATRGLDVVRGEVLRHAGFPASTTAAGSPVALALKAVAGGASLGFGIPAAVLAMALGGWIVLSADPNEQELAEPVTVASSHRPLSEAKWFSPRREIAVSSSKAGDGSHEESAMRSPGADGAVGIRGVVLGEDGEPLSGILVQATPGPRTGSRRTALSPKRTAPSPKLTAPSPKRTAPSTEPNALPAALTDETGAFAFEGLEEGTWSFTVDDERFARLWDGEHVRELPARQDEEDDSLEIRLHEPRTLLGVVVDEADVPVPHARVRLAREWIAGDEGPLQPGLAEVLHEVTTSAGGGFELERLRPGRIEVVLEHSDHALTLVETRVSEEERVRIVVGGGWTLNGRVVADGTSLLSVPVRAAAPELDGLELGSWTIDPDESGEFRIDRIPRVALAAARGLPALTAFVEEGPWTSPHYRVFADSGGRLPYLTLVATTAGGARAHPTVEVRSDEAPIAAVAGPADDGSGSIRVRFASGVSADGEPQEPLPVHLAAATDPGRVLRSSQPGTDGEVVFDDVPAGRYSIWVRNKRSPNFAPAERALRGGETLAVVLDHGAGVLRGTVREGWNPVAGGRVTLRPRSVAGSEGFGLAVGSVDETGDYSVAGVTPGEYDLTYAAPLSMACTFAVHVDDGSSAFDVDLPRGRIDGMVGASRAGEAVSPTPPEAARITRRDVTAARGAGVVVPLDETGRFHVAHLAAGHYNVYLSESGREYLATQVAISDERPRVALAISTAGAIGRLSGELRGLDGLAGAPGEQFYVTAHPLDGRGYDAGVAHWGRLDASTGAWEVEDLPSGTYGLRFGSTRSSLPTIWVPAVQLDDGGNDKAVDVIVPDGGKVAVADPKGAEGSDPDTWQIRTPGGNWLPLALFRSGLRGDEADGAPLELTLPAGVWEIQAAPHDGGPPVRTTLRVEPGQTPRSAAIGTPRSR